MNMTQFEGYKYIDGGVCASQGFQANGLNCGLNPDKEKNDLGMVYSKEPCQTAAVYTFIAFKLCHINKSSPFCNPAKITKF